MFIYHAKDKIYFDMNVMVGVAEIRKLPSGWQKIPKGQSREWATDRGYSLLSNAFRSKVITKIQELNPLVT